MSDELGELLDPCDRDDPTQYASVDVSGNAWIRPPEQPRVNPMIVRDAIGNVSAVEPYRVRTEMSWGDTFFWLGCVVAIVWALSEIRAELKQINSHIAVELKPEKPEGK